MVLHDLKAVIVTLYLFTKSDFKTIMFPITIFSQALAKSHSLSRFLIVVFWIWLHLLQFDVANQSSGKSPEEDALNKPYRPIPAKRISLRTARTFRWILVPICFLYSYICGGVEGTIIISALNFIYNEAEGASHWLIKNACNAGFYAGFEYGATIVADPTTRLSQDQLAAIAGSMLIIFTTVHAQDFRDDIGDALLGRRTFSLVFPTLSRISMPLTLIPWSIALCYLSTVSSILLYGQVAWSVWLSARFWCLRGAIEDQYSYSVYNLWLCMVHVALSGLDQSHLPDITMTTRGSLLTEIYYRSSMMLNSLA